MRHLGGIVIGFFGVVVGLVVIAAALGLTSRAAEQFTRAPLLLGTVLMAVGGAAIGAVAIFRRMSVTAPLTGATLALLLTVVGALAPSWPYELGLGRSLGGGLSALLSLQLPALVAGVLFLTSVGVAAPRVVAQAAPAGMPPAEPSTGPSRPTPSNRGACRVRSASTPDTTTGAGPVPGPAPWSRCASASRSAQRPFGRGCGGSGGRPLPVHLISSSLDSSPRNLVRGPRPA